MKKKPEEGSASTEAICYPIYQGCDTMVINQFIRGSFVNITCLDLFGLVVCSPRHYFTLCLTPEWEKCSIPSAHIYSEGWTSSPLGQQHFMSRQDSQIHRIIRQKMAKSPRISRFPMISQNGGEYTPNHPSHWTFLKYFKYCAPWWRAYPPF